MQPGLAGYCLLLTRLAQDDQEGYRTACADLYERLAASADAHQVNFLVRACALAPDALADLPRVVALAEKHLVRDPKNYAFLNTAGTILYRAGRYEAAIQRLTEAMKARESGQGSAPDWLVLAMAHHRLGHGPEARQWLEKARTWIGQAKAGKVNDPLVPLKWNVRLELDLLSREAEAEVGR
jgi:tetratricopeptide (TPR) repeat protein